MAKPRLRLITPANALFRSFQLDDQSSRDADAGLAVSLKKVAVCTFERPFSVER